ncbi:MAG: HNH endonuclease [Nitrososphaerota archaeon]
MPEDHLPHSKDSEEYSNTRRKLDAESKRLLKYWKSLEKKENEKDIIRKGFPEQVKEQILKKQNLRCNNCRKLLTIMEFDHIDGNRGNNSPENCQALCPNCHAQKSRSE